MHSFSTEDPRLERLVEDHGFEVLEVLADPFCRRLLRYVDGSQYSLEHLAEVFVGWICVERGITADAYQRGRMKLLLYHYHLPRLAARNLIRWKDERTVEGCIPADIRTIADRWSSISVKSVLLVAELGDDWTPGVQ